MVRNEGFSWSFLSLYNATCSGCYVTQTEVNSVVEILTQICAVTHLRRTTCAMCVCREGHSILLCPKGTGISALQATARMLSRGDRGGRWRLSKSTCMHPMQAGLGIPVLAGGLDWITLIKWLNELRKCTKLVPNVRLGLEIQWGTGAADSLFTAEHLITVARSFLCVQFPPTCKTVCSTYIWWEATEAFWKAFSSKGSFQPVDQSLSNLKPHTHLQWNSQHAEWEQNCFPAWCSATSKAELWQSHLRLMFKLYQRWLTTQTILPVW